jgi:GGDEF domain-containing protein
MRVGVPGGEIALTASLGVVTLDEEAALKGDGGDEGPSLDLLVRRAEGALLRAKQGGRDQLQSD